MSQPIKNIALEKAKKWTTSPFDKETINEVEKLIQQNDEQLIDSFYKDLDFGTGGLRGVMGVGSNKLNKYTIGTATQGLANFLQNNYPSQTIAVAIAYDCRNNSSYFAQLSAEILSANNIKIFLFESLRPTPMLSYAVRKLNCQAGIVITASHNPKEYNGYKVYGNDGAQLVSPDDKNVITEVRKVNIDEIKFDSKKELIHYLNNDFDDDYIETLKNYSIKKYFNSQKNNLSIVFTSIHGTGGTIVPKALHSFGFNNVHIVEEQQTPDGNFSTVIYPNPEEHEALSIAIAQAKKVNADIVFGTDPDADRVGMVVNHYGEYILLNGNQTATLLVDFILNNKELPKNPFIVKTIVTTPLLKKIADDQKIECFDTLTGFKYIAELIRKFEGKKQFVVGGEESYGYLVGDDVRDKDAVSSTLLLSEAAAHAKENNQTLIDVLFSIYQKHGYYLEDLVSITKKGFHGAEEIQQLMNQLRQQPPILLAGIKVIEVRDYQKSIIKNLILNTTSSIDLPNSNVIQLVLEDESIITIRPSGTEPKIKFYFSVCDKNITPASYQEMKKLLTDKITLLKKSMSI
jgi:phosphoglucomutase